MARPQSLVRSARELCILLNHAVEGVERAEEPGDVAEQADAVCTYYQGLAICELVLDEETDAFFHHMIRSAQSRRWLLERCRRPRGDALPDVAVASNTRGLFAALVARQWKLAADVARRSPPEPKLDTEYEEDFAYAHVLHLHVLGASAAKVQAALARLEEAMQGDTSPRLALCRALLAGSTKGAAKAFAGLLADRTKYLAKAKRASGGDPLFRPFSEVYVEGLAWLALLEREGIALRGDYPYCPERARAKKYAPFEVTSFPSVRL
jgi:hypothetical protein